MGMTFVKKSFIIYFLGLMVQLQAQPNCGPIPQNFNVSQGYAVTLIATNLTSPRGIAFDNNGALLVVQKGKGIVRLGDGCTNRSTLIAQTDLNHGIWVTGSTLYASSPAACYAWDYPSLANPRTLVYGMENQDHSTRTLLIPSNSPDLMVITRGSQSNLDVGAWDISSGRSEIRTFNLSTVPKGGYNWLDGALVAWGVRNEVGIAEDWQHNLWGVENSADQLVRGGVDIHLAQPSEELNFFGNPLKPNSTFYGYPDCYTVWDPAYNLATGQQFALNPNSTFTDATCNGISRAASMSMHPHSAPLDMKFAYGTTSSMGLKMDGSLYVSFHGSWNSNPPTGYKVVRIPYVNGTSGPGPAANITSQVGYQDIFSNNDLDACPSGCFRPVGLAFDKLGRLMVSSDSTGQIFMITNASTATGAPSVQTGAPSQSQTTQDNKPITNSPSSISSTPTQRSNVDQIGVHCIATFLVLSIILIL